MICPKCGRPVPEAAVICPACDFILDTDFLGEEILDEEKKLRPGAGGLDPQEFNLADAVILGDIDENSQAFETSDTGFHVKETTGARLYVSGRSQALMAPDAIPARVEPRNGRVRLTPFEKHVMKYIDGTRPVEEIRQVAGLDETEVKTALATLADKGVVKVVGRALMALGVPTEAMIRRPERRRLKRDIAGAMGSVSDETDRAIEEAFKTRTGLSPINPADLEPDAISSDENVFSDIGPDDEEFEAPRPTNELLSLASSSTPVQALPPGKERTKGSFVPISRTADPPPFSGEASDGFDDFGSGTGQVDLNVSSSSSAGPQSVVSLGPGASRLSQGGSFDDDMSIISPGSDAIAQLANSELAGQAMAEDPESFSDDTGGETQAAEGATQARAPSFSLPLSRLLSDDGEDGDKPFASLAEVESSGRPVPPPVVGEARNSSIASAENLFSGFKGSAEQSETGTKTPAMTPQKGLKRSGKGAAGQDFDEDTPVDASGGPGESQGETAPSLPQSPAPPPGMPPGRATTGEIDDLLAALSEEQSEEARSLSLSSFEVEDASGGRPRPEPSTGPVNSLSEGSMSLAEPASDDEPSIEISSSMLSISPEVAESIDLSSVEAALPGEDVSLRAPDQSEEGLPSHLEPPPPSGLAPETRVVDLSEEPALSELVDGFGEHSDFGPDSAVFDRPPQMASIGHSMDEEETRSPPPEASSAKQSPPLAGAENPSTGEVSKVFTRDGVAPPIAASEDDDDSMESTNLLEDPRLAAGFGDQPGAVPLSGPAARLGADNSDEATALRSRGAIPGVISPDADGSSEMVESANFVRPPAASAPLPSELSMGARPTPAMPGPGEVRRDDSIMEDSVLSELPSEDSAYDGSADDSYESYEESDEQAAEGAGQSDLGASGTTSEIEKVLRSSSGGQPIDHALPASLIDDSALASEVEPGIRSDPGDDPDATAYVRSPTGLVSVDSHAGSDSGVGWGEGTVDYEREDEVSTGEEELVSASQVSVGGSAALLSSSGLGQGPLDRGDQEALGSDEMREKARRLFRDALRDYKSGRTSRARMNAKLATIYDPQNEEYRSQLEAWEGESDRPPTSNGKPREVLLYEEAQVLEREGEYDGAITLLRQGIAVNPLIAAFHNRLGVLLAIRKHNYTEAASFVKRAIELEPDNMHYKSNYGKIVQKARLKGQPRA